MQRWVPGVPQETWVDRRIREAEEQGAFTRLGTAGKPLDEASLTQSAQEWAIRWARREGADLVAALPPALALRVERERVVAAVPGLAGEAAVTRAVASFNADLDAAYRRPQETPPVAVPFLDLDRELGRWRAAHPAPASAEEATGPAVPPPVSAPGRRRWWLLGRRRRPRVRTGAWPARTSASPPGP